MQPVTQSEHRLLSSKGVRSLLVSLLFHALLGVLLWCLVITITRPESIFLIGSIPAGPKSTSVDVTLDDDSASADGEPVADRTELAASDAALDALIADVLQDPGSAGFNPSRQDPPSVEFFGTRAIGNQFVFVMDVSYSMNARAGERFRRASDELIRAVSQLQPGQRYYVFLFCWNLEEMFFDRGIQYLDVTAGHESRLRDWIRNASLGAGTDPRRALSLARRMNPDAVFLLSDGEFNEPTVPLSETGWLDEQGERLEMGVQEGVEQFYQRVPIHTIAFENPFTSPAMERISKVTGGQFRYVKTESVQPVDVERFVRSIRRLAQKHRQDEDVGREYLSRLSLARDLICDGELLYAEYIIRPLYQAPPSEILNPTLWKEVQQILDSELGDARLEDFEQPAVLRPMVSPSP